MFWKILLGWTVVGAVLEIIAILCIGVYAASRFDASGNDKAYRSDMMDKIRNDVLEKHFEWSNWLYRMFPHLIADIIEMLWKDPSLHSG